MILIRTLAQEQSETVDSFNQRIQDYVNAYINSLSNPTEEGISLHYTTAHDKQICNIIIKPVRVHNHAPGAIPTRL